MVRDGRLKSALVKRAARFCPARFLAARCISQLAGPFRVTCLSVFGDHILPCSREIRDAIGSWEGRLVSAVGMLGKLLRTVGNMDSQLIPRTDFDREGERRIEIQ